MWDGLKKGWLLFTGNTPDRRDELMRIHFINTGNHLYQTICEHGKKLMSLQK